MAIVVSLPDLAFFAVGQAEEVESEALDGNESPRLRLDTRESSSSLPPFSVGFNGRCPALNMTRRRLQAAGLMMQRN